MFDLKLTNIKLNENLFGKLDDLMNIINQNVDNKINLDLEEFEKKKKNLKIG